MVLWNKKRKLPWHISLMLFVSFALIIPSIFSDIGALDALNLIHEHTIRVALYDTWGYNNHYIQQILDYNWSANNSSYQFHVTTITKDDVAGMTNLTLTNENFDVFIIGASAESYLIDGLNVTWKHAVQEFVAHGGGYMGICGGANAASYGFEDPKNWFHRRVNDGVLGLADVYINDDLLEEWQYLLKFGFSSSGDNQNHNLTPSYISVNTTVEKTSDNAIFIDYEGNYRYITYAGGPGLYVANKKDSRLGSVVPLLTYNEEPMDTKPIHYWRPTINGWKILRNVTTNLWGEYAGIATTYNNSGRIILYGPHPENKVIVNGTIQEYIGHNIINFMLPIETYVFNYFGTPLDDTYNWWIIRRSVAWSAHISDEDLPNII